MDATTRRLVDYTLGFAWADLTESARDLAVRHLADSLACAIAGYFTEPAQAAVRVASRVGSDTPVTVLGAGITSAPAYGAFANTVMVRALDWNDGMLARGGGHPSDLVAGLLAAAEVVGASGVELLEAMTLSYEVLGALGNAAPVHERGWDQGTFMGVAAALGIGRLYGLSADQLANAVSISIVPAIPLMVTRRGELSHWKGAATAAAILNATNAVALAREGFTGPSEPFEGRHGVIEQVSGPLELSLPVYPDGPRVVELSHLKAYPAETHAQGLLGIVPEIRAWTAIEEIASVEVEAYRIVYSEIGSHPSVWDPKTRETADHSLPYLLAVAMVDGEVTLDSFRPERIADPALRPLMAKIRIVEDPALTANYRPPGLEIAGNPCVRITIRKTTGETFAREVTFPKGHFRNPLTREDIDAKLQKICAGVVKDDVRDEIRAALWEVARAPDVRGLLALLGSFAADGAARGTR
ncbi:MAG TPA: MmgE/PrpD family protein [Acidimicrobiales bacterium]|nr:MmgE/PrpD family protein [Acidimicrobiales bacterium]